MNALVFFAGCGFGILVFTIVCGVFVALNRKQAKEQREVNERSQKAMEEGNRLRHRRAEAMDRIAESLDAILRKMP